MLGVRPEVVAHDLHPEYLATKWALEQDAELVGVQHHHAHAAACLAEHGETGPGARARLRRHRLRHRRHALGRRAPPLRPRRLRAARVARPGAAARAARRRSAQPWRTAAVAPRARRPARCRGRAGPRCARASAANAPLSSGMGRLFDAVAALLGVRDEVTYEGQAAIELEQLAGGVDGGAVGVAVRRRARARGDVSRRARRRGAPGAEIAAAFHETVAAGAAAACAEAAEPRTVVLSGGSFQNLRLLASTRARLEARRLPRAHAPARAAERRRHQLRPGGRRGLQRVATLQRSP